jgi:hypothetical protein
VTLTYFTDRALGQQFPNILRDAGLTIVRHSELFPPHGSDEQWLERVGAEGWIAVTHDRRIRYKPNELKAVDRHRVGLLVVIGTAPFPALAANFVATLPRIEPFLAAQTRPFIGKVYRPPPTDLTRDSSAPGPCGVVVSPLTSPAYTGFIPRVKP